MCRNWCKHVVSIAIVAIWPFCCVSLVAAAKIKPPQSIMKRKLSHGVQTNTTPSADAESGSVITPSYLSPAQYIVIDIEPADSHSFSKGYGINNLSQVVGRT